MSEKYSTNELVKAIEYHIIEHDRPLREEEANAIIAKLRAEDKLCEDIKVVSEVLQNPFPPEVIWVDERTQLGNLTSKAIADYKAQGL